MTLTGISARGGNLFFEALRQRRLRNSIFDIVLGLHVDGIDRAYRHAQATTGTVIVDHDMKLFGFALYRVGRARRDTKHAADTALGTDSGKLGGGHDHAPV